MRRGVSGHRFHEHVQAVIDEIGIADPREAIRIKARSKIAVFSSLFALPPYDLVAFASCVDLLWSDVSPAFSQDSEIAPTADGRVVLRVNQDRPITRQRFSIAHEIGHTLFPEYQYSVKCRKATERRWDDDDLLESLCDVAASEFMFPLPWFSEKLESIEFTGINLVQLADDCLASREAMARRIVELSEEPMAAVFFSWKLKPAEEKQARRDAKQTFMFAELAPEQPIAKLRVDYAIMNEAYRTNDHIHIPKHKSVENSGPIYQAAISQMPSEGKAALRLGKIETDFDIVALPIFTEEHEVGPNRASSVVAILRPAV